jgi:hypothetical protein
MHTMMFKVVVIVVIIAIIAKVAANSCSAAMIDSNK